MHPQSFILPLSLWAATADAFYGYCPPWIPHCGGGTHADVMVNPRENSPSTKIPGFVAFPLTGRPEYDIPSNPDKVAREVAHLKRKFSRLRTRENNYDIDPAADPTQEFAVGIDQDGTDFSYFAEVKFGSNQKTLYMLTDTGAGTSWVMGSSCTSTACGLHNSFGPEDSTTFKQSKDEFSIGYSTGAVSGNVASDTISVAGLTLDFQFGLADEISDDFIHFPFDGILGLARKSGRTKAFLETIKAAKAIPSNIYCFYLGRASDGANMGELSLGAANPDKFEGEITYTTIVDTNGDWIIPMDGVSYDDKQVVGSMPSYIDTGTTYMFGPPETVAKLHRAIPGAQSSDNVTWTVPCDTKSEPMLTFSGVNFAISKEDWLSPPNNDVCTSNIYGIEVLAGSWLIGGTFLKNVYSIFDNDNARVGFAKKVVLEGSISSVPTKTSTSSGSPTGVLIPSLGITGGETNVPTDSTSAPISSSPDLYRHTVIFTLIACVLASSALLA